MKNIFKKIWAFFKGLLRSTKFDNTLFKIGVDRVFDQVLKSLNGLDVKVSVLLSQVKMNMLSEFKNYKIITKLINSCFKWIDTQIAKSKVFDGYEVEKKVLYIRDKIIKWYNDNY